MAAVTGKIRRDSCPFLWVCVVRIKEFSAEEDGIVQECLLINDSTFVL